MQPRQEWVRDVTEEGIHPHPGPPQDKKANKRGRRRRAGVRLRFLTCNVQAAPGVWTAFELYKDTHDVMGLQEVKMHSDELCAFRRHAGSQGFNCYHLAGPQTTGGWGEDRETGGIMMLVRKALRQQEIRKIQAQKSQIILVMVDK